MDKTHEALKLIEAGRDAVLATLEDGKPFTSAVNYFYLPGETPFGKLGKMCFLMSELARHTQNAHKNPNVSLFVIEEGNQPLYQKKRVSAQAVLHTVNEDSVFKNHKARYLEIFPGSKQFFDFTDFRFFEAQISEIHFIGGFGNIQSLK